MQGDKVSITSTITEIDNELVEEVIVGDKPEFMLDSEYNSCILTCGENAVMEACNRLANGSIVRAKNIAYYIAEEVVEKFAKNHPEQ